MDNPNILVGTKVKDCKNFTGRIASVKDDEILVDFSLCPSRGLKYEIFAYPYAFNSKTLKSLSTDSEVKEKIKYDKSLRESIAFKYRYCDGGGSETNIGYCGVCSDEAIKNNVGNDSNWCGLNQCKEYSDNRCTRQRLEELYKKGHFFCYESEFLRTWKAGIGKNRDGSARHLGYNVLNGLSIMTTTGLNPQEKERYVFAVFLIGNIYLGDGDQEGYVSVGTGDIQYKMVLSRQESCKIKFWNYYNDNSMNPLWAEGLYRYISHEQAARILSDIVDVKENPKEKEYAKEFLDYFCKLHNIGMIPERAGKLAQN